MDNLPTTLLDVLSNSLVLRQTAPYITARNVLALAATSKAIRHVLGAHADVWRYVNLTDISSARIDSSPIDVGGMSWRAERMDESLTEVFNSEKNTSVE